MDNNSRKMQFSGTANNHTADTRRGSQSHSRVPPHSVEAEESVLGGIMLDNDAINVAMERIKAEDFYRAAHHAIFTGMTTLVDRREPIDVITLAATLRSMGLLDQSGGMEYLARLATLVPSAANVGFYAKVVREMAMRRRVIHEATEVINSAFSPEGDVDEFIDQAEQRILGVSDQRIGRAFFRVGELVQDSIKQVEKLYDLKSPVTGVPTGFEDLDRITAGLQPSDLIILAARPSMGKTSLALCIAQHVGLYENRAVAVFSLEMSKEQLVLRMLCSEARVDNSRVRIGQLNDRDFPKLIEAASKIAEAPIFIDDTPALPISEMRAKARRLHREHPLGLIVVDYLQLMRSPTYSSSREQEISDISRSLKAVAKELGVPVLALSQLNRSVESRNDKRPMMSDLRESGAIEQDADIIAFIYRDEVYNPETPDKGTAELLISKQRNGPTGMVRLAFLPEYTRFESHIALAEFSTEPATMSVAFDEYGDSPGGAGRAVTGLDGTGRSSFGVNPDEHGLFDRDIFDRLEPELQRLDRKDIAKFDGSIRQVESGSPKLHEDGLEDDPF